MMIPQSRIHPPWFGAWPGWRREMWDNAGCSQRSQAPRKDRLELDKYLRWIVLKLESQAKCPGIGLLLIWLRYLADLWWSLMTRWWDPHSLSISCWGHATRILSDLSGAWFLARRSTCWLCLEWHNLTLGRIADWGVSRCDPQEIEIIRLEGGQWTSNQVQKIGGARFHGSKRRDSL